MSKVLVVDDSKTIRAIAGMYLKKFNVDTLFAEDGFDALSLIIKEKPSLIFVDIVMPKIDGYQLCTMIKSNQGCKEIPVIILSSRDTVFDKAKGKISGCDGYLVKPFTQDEIIELTKKYVQLN
ncbi:MAG: response regulator [Methylacidiphilales bacterium]|nr:response regulator [Candidatus Methylacidiphilales bacterium]